MKTKVDIATSLNAAGLKAEGGRSWTRGIVREILTNEKYIGHNVYNRISFKLKKKRVKNPREIWVRYEGAFGPVVDFAATQALWGHIVLVECKNWSVPAGRRVPKMYRGKGE